MTTLIVEAKYPPYIPHKPVETNLDRLALYVGGMFISGFRQECGSWRKFWDLIGVAMNVQASIILKIWVTVLDFYRGQYKDFLRYF